MKRTTNCPVCGEKILVDLDVCIIETIKPEKAVTGGSSIQTNQEMLYGDSDHGLKPCKERGHGIQNPKDTK